MKKRLDTKLSHIEKEKNDKKRIEKYEKIKKNIYDSYIKRY